MNTEAKTEGGGEDDEKSGACSGTMVDVEEMKRLKSEGNEFFKAKAFKEAAASYSGAIDLDQDLETDDLHILFSNRSAAYHSCQRYQEALDDATQSVSLKRLFGKGYGRQGDALFGLGKYKEAIEAYELALTMDGANKPKMKKEIENCKKALSQSITPHPLS